MQRMRAGGGRRPPGASRVVGGLPSLPPPSDCAGAALLLPEPGPGLSGGQRGGQELHGKPRLSSQGALPGLGSRSLSLVGGPSERGDLTCSSLEKAPNEVAEPGLTRGSARQGVRLGRGHRNLVLSLNDMSLTS